jgi:hypothetical protein
MFSGFSPNYLQNCCTERMNTTYEFKFYSEYHKPADFMGREGVEEEKDKRQKKRAEEETGDKKKEIGETANCDPSQPASDFGALIKIAMRTCGKYVHGGISM